MINCLISYHSDQLSANFLQNKKKYRHVRFLRSTKKIWIEENHMPKIKNFGLVMFSFLEDFELKNGGHNWTPQLLQEIGTFYWPLGTIVSQYIVKGVHHSSVTMYKFFLHGH